MSNIPTYIYTPGDENDSSLCHSGFDFIHFRCNLRLIDKFNMSFIMNHFKTSNDSPGSEMDGC